MIIRVLLVEDALDVKLESKMFCIVIRWNNNTEGQLISIVLEIICLFQSGLF